MSNLTDHEAEQAAITEQCEAGTCGHADCATYVDDQKPANRGVRIMVLLMGEYASDADTVIRDALTDLRHACDILGISYGDEDDAAMDFYRSDITTNPTS